MSHYTIIRTEIGETPILLQSLHEMGYAEVECHEYAQPLFGHLGDRRPETAEVIIRRKHIGPMANDVGFKRQESGNFQAIISEYDRQATCNEAWVQKLNRLYAYNIIQDQVREQGLIVEQEQTLENGDTVIILSERG